MENNMKEGTKKKTPPETMKHGKYMQCTNKRHRNV